MCEGSLQLSGEGPGQEGDLQVEGSTLAISPRGCLDKAGSGLGRGQGRMSEEGLEMRDQRGSRRWRGPYTPHTCVPAAGVGEEGAGLAFLGADVGQHQLGGTPLQGPEEMNS